MPGVPYNCVTVSRLRDTTLRKQRLQTNLRPRFETVEIGQQLAHRAKAGFQNILFPRPDGRSLHVEQVHDAQMQHREDVHDAETARRDEMHIAELGRRDQLHIDEMALLAAAIESRDVIGQAKGVIMVSVGCTADEAFELLKRQSQHENRKLVEVAAEIAARAQRKDTSGWSESSP